MDDCSHQKTDEPLKVWQVLLEEMKRLRPRDTGLGHLDFGDADAGDAKCLPILFEHIHSWSGDLGASDPWDSERQQETAPDKTPPLTALCFSGGGIRSATFNLGVLQRLAKLGLLSRFDYLSSVSGGGYISSWLARWIHAEGGVEAVQRKLAAEPPLDPDAPEPQQVTYLRQYSNYLTPRLGLLSADTWTLVAIGVRNILLNWLVLVPILTALVLVPLLAVARWPTVWQGISWWPPLMPSWSRAWAWRIPLVLAYLLELAGLFWIFRFRDSGRDEREEEKAGKAKGNDGRGKEDGSIAKGKGGNAERKDKPPPYLVLGLLPRLAALIPLLLGFYLYRSYGPSGRPTWLGLFGYCVVWAVALPILALWASEWRPSRNRSALEWDSLWLLVAGGLEAMILAAVFVGWAQGLVESESPLYAILGPGLVIGPVLLGRTLFVALSSMVEHKRAKGFGDADREWWARWSAWGLISALVWIVGSALVLYAPTLLRTGAAQAAAAVSAGGFGTLVAWLGKSASTPATKEAPGATKGAGGSPLKSALLGLAAPLFVVALILCLSTGAQHLLARLEGRSAKWLEAGPSPRQVQGAGSLHLEVESTAPDGERPQPFRADFQVKGRTAKPSVWRYLRPYDASGPWELAAIAVLLSFGYLAGYPININRFSMQAGYRNRLIRAYFGASNSDRRPNLFTGFDPNDNVLLHELSPNLPFPVINIALNLVRGQNLAWQERKAESFTATPLHCGAKTVGYRRSRHYGGKDGITLGTAVATSGAAANPNMGFNSSPAITFIMTFFTVRLGAWLGNPSNPRKSRWHPPHTRSGPRFSAWELVCEAFGWTDESHPYISLSDGGHFEDLGLYEMVRRRCRFILVCDAGADPEYGFKDLGNAIRKIRIDLGIPIVFEERVYILPKQESGQAASGQARYCAVARIRYDAVDKIDRGSGEQIGGEEKGIGTLIYIKPSICEQPAPATPFDVANYARFSPDFPHETTADQWFTETQFESYRALGDDVVRAMAMNKACPSLTELARRVREEYLPQEAKMHEARPVYFWNEIGK
jgi:hypothetical protein